MMPYDCEIVGFMGYSLIITGRLMSFNEDMLFPNHRMITYLRNLTLHFQRHLILNPNFSEFESFNFIFCGIFFF